MHRTPSTPTVDVEACLKLIAPHEPPSGALINAVLEHADIREDIGRGLVALRLSQRRLKDPLVREGLGREGRRLKDVSVVWDDDAGQIVKVCDDGEVRQASDWSATYDELSELDTFELTDAALAYVAQFDRGRRTPARAR